MRVLHVTEYRHKLNKKYCLIQYYVAKNRLTFFMYDNEGFTF